jgi:hypothetical protein
MVCSGVEVGLMSQNAVRPVVLLNDAALRLPRETVSLPGGARIILAGRSPVGLRLAELALPGARIIWTDFRQSASLGALHAAVRASGGLDHLILAADGDEGEATFALMCAVLSLLPALRRPRGAQIELIAEAGSAMSSLEQFVARIGPRLATDGIRMTLRPVLRQTAHSAA